MIIQPQRITLGKLVRLRGNTESTNLVAESEERKSPVPFFLLHLARAECAKPSSQAGST